MKNNPGEGRASERPDLPLAELSERITRRLQSGEPVEADDYSEEYPACSGPIRRFLPTLRDLADLGRSFGRDPRPPGPGKGPDRR